MKEIETKLRAVLAVKKCSKRLEPHEEYAFNYLEKKYRDDKGKLETGSFIINSKGHWEQVR